MDKTDVELKVVLVHGIVSDDELLEASMWCEDATYVSECFVEDYQFGLISTRELESDEISDIIMSLEDNIDEIPQLYKSISPAFVGKQVDSVVLETREGMLFQFLGGIWGCDEEGNMYGE